MILQANVGLIVALSVIGAIIFIILISSIRIVRQTEKFIVERLGGFHKIWDVGIHMLLPFFDRVAYKISMKEQVRDYEPQEVITKDNVTMKIDTVVFYCVTDPKLYAYGVENPRMALENLSATTLRNIIGELDLDETLTSRDVINAKMRVILDEATDPWGIKVNRVEVKNILPPKDIREAMEKQMAILRAEGEAESLRQVKKAEADGIRAVREAEAEGLKMLNASKPTDPVVTLRYYESLAKIADGKATKIFLPNNLEKAASLASVVKEVIKD